MLIDLHTHTFPKSDDSRLSPEELIIYAKRNGLDGVCVTEHDGFWSKESTARLSEEHNFLLIPGVEIDTEEGHIIAFGIKRNEFGTHRVSFLRDTLNKNGGFMILAHPYRHTYFPRDDIDKTIGDCCQNPIYRFVDTVETLNGRGSVQENMFSQELAYRLGYKGTGGSDTHMASDMPSCATHFERDIRSIEELIQELKAGRYHAVDLRKSS